MDLYRSMIPDDDGCPVAGRSARTLGVRIPRDISPDASGVVFPGTGGLSTAPEAWENLPHHRRPPRLGKGSCGHEDDRVYVAKDAEIVQDRSLLVRVDSTTHALVEPSLPTPLTDYEQELASTRYDWLDTGL